MNLQTFESALIAEPANQALRLVYADWLEEHGRCTQAEYVRLCNTPVPATRHKEDWIPGCACARCRHFDRAAKLLHTHGASWLGLADRAFGVLNAPRWPTYTQLGTDDHALFLEFAGGLLASSYFLTHDWLRWGPLVLRAAPTLRNVHLRDNVLMHRNRVGYVVAPSHRRSFGPRFVLAQQIFDRLQEGCLSRDGTLRRYPWHAKTGSNYGDDRSRACLRYALETDPDTL